MYAVQFQNNHWKVIEKAKHIILILPDVPGIEKPFYHIIRSDLYSIIGNCYMNLDMLTEAKEYHQLDRANGLAHNIKDAVSRSTDYIGVIYHLRSEFLNAITM